MHCQNQLCNPSFFHIEQDCQESLNQEKICNQQSSNEGLKYLLNFRELFDSKVSGLHPCDNMAMIH